MQSRCRAVHLSPSRPLSFFSMCHEQLSLSHRPSLQSLTSVISVGEMLRRTYPRRVDDSSSAGWCSIGGWKIIYEPHDLDGREATVVHAVLVSWQQTSCGQLQWSRWIGFQDRWCFSSVSFLCASLRAHGSVRCHNNTHAYFVSGWEKEAERDDHFRTAPTENSGPKFKFRLLRSLVKLITFQNFKPKREWTSQKCCKISLRLKALFFTLQPVFPVLKAFSKIALHTFVANYRLLAPVHHK